MIYYVKIAIMDFIVVHWINKQAICHSKCLIHARHIFFPWKLHWFSFILKLKKKKNEQRYVVFRHSLAGFRLIIIAYTTSRLNVFNFISNDANSNGMRSIVESFEWSCAFFWPLLIFFSEKRIPEIFRMEKTFNNMIFFNFNGVDLIYHFPAYFFHARFQFVNELMPCSVIN